jgi:hypothetical protein
MIAHDRTAAPVTSFRNQHNEALGGAHFSDFKSVRSGNLL